MKIEEAIKLQDQLKGLLPEVGFNKYLASTQLGIEALKRVQKYRPFYAGHPHLLPGETDD